MRLSRRILASILCAVMMLSILPTVEYEVKAASTLITEDTTVTKDSNHTLTAHWEAESYVLNFDGYPSYQKSITFDAQYGQLPEPTKTGYKFKGWYFGEDGTGTQLLPTDIVSIDNDHTVYAKWVKTYSLVYDLSGGSEAIVDSVEYEAGNIVTISAITPTRTGFDFTGWKAEKTGDANTVYFTSQNSGTTFSMPDYDLTLTALWNANVHFQLLYDIRGGEGEFLDSTYYEYGQSATVLAGTPTKYGYTFREWTENLDGSGIKYTGGSSSIPMNSNVTIYAQWTSKKVTIDMGEYGTKEVDFGDEIGALPNPTKQGYDFGGWWTETGGGSEITASFVVEDEGTIVLYPKWTPNVYYKLTYQLNGGTGTFIDDNQYAHGQIATISSSIPDKYGYTFKEWNREENGAGTAEAGGSTISMTENISLWAQWTSIKVTVDFGEGNTKEVDFGDEIGILPNPTKPGFDFDGWYDETGGTGNKVTESTIIDDEGPVTLYPKWTPNAHYTLTYDLKGGTGSVNDSTQYTYGQSATVSSSIPTKYGYTFKEWTEAENGSGNAISAGSSIIMTSDVTLYAQWMPKKVTVNLGSEGSKEIDFGDEIGTLPNPTKPGSDFGGWWTEENGGGSQVFEDTVLDTEGPLVLYPNFLTMEPVLTKISDVTEVIPGENIVYTITAGNTGTAAWNGVIATDELPPEVEYVTYNTSDSVAVSDNSGVLTLDFGDIAPGTSKEVKITVRVKNGITLGTPIVNSVSCDGMVSVDPSTPVVTKVSPSVAKTSNIVEVNPGGDIEYTITAGNSGTAVWKNVVAVDILPGNVQYKSFNGTDGVTVSNDNNTLTIDFGNIPPGESKTVLIKVKVNDTVVIGEKIANSITVPDPNGGNDITVIDPGAPLVTPTPVASPILEKSSNIAEILPGEEIVYTITAGNSGTAVWPGVTATDVLPDEVDYVTFSTEDEVTVSHTDGVLTIGFGDIAAGESKTVLITVMVKNSVSADTRIVNSVSCGGITATDPVKPKVTRVVPSLVKTSNVTTVNPGGDIVYTITAGNSGTADWNNVIAVDILPVSMEYKSFSGTDGVTVSDDNNTLTIDFGNILVGESKIVLITVKVKATAEIGEPVTNSISVPDPNGGHITVIDPDAPRVTPTPVPSPALEKSSNVSEIVPGGNIVYTITASNSGATTWYSAEVTDVLPAEVDFVSFAATGGITVMNNDGTLIIGFGDIASGASKTVRITVRVKDSVTSGVNITNSISGGGVTATDPVKPKVTRVIPSLIKTSNVTTVNPGADVVYTITAGNSGTADWNNVIAVDILPSSMEYKSFSGTDGVTVSDNNGTLTIDFGNILPDESKTVLITVKVKATADIGEPVTNSISVPDPNGGSAIAAVDPDAPLVTPTPVAVPALEKSSSVSEIMPGGNIVYAIRASNTGTETWYSAEVTDVLPNEVDFASFAATGGITVMNNDGTLTIGFGDIAPGASKTVNITVRVKDSVALGATITNSISGGGVSATDPVKPIVKRVIPSLTKTSNVTTVSPDSEIIYTIEAENSGSAVWNNVVAIDSLPANVAYVSFSTTDGVTVSNTAGILTIDFGNILALSSKKVHITVRVQTDAEIGKMITNSVSVSNPNGGPDIITSDPDAPNITAIPASKPTLEKTSDINEVRVGSNIVYTITAGNSGNASWDNVIATDILSASVSYVSASSDEGVIVTEANNILTLNFGNIAPNSSKSVVVTVRVKDNATVGMPLVNIVTCGGLTAADTEPPEIIPKEPEYRILYDLAGGNGTYEDTTSYKSGEVVAVTDYTPIKESYVFDGWKDGDGIFRNAGDLLTFTGSDILLTALWKQASKQDVLTVIYMTDDNKTPLTTETIDNYTGEDLTEAFVTSLLGDGWIDKHRPDTTYENGVISFPDKDTVNVLYRKLYALTYIYVGNSSVSHHTTNEAVTITAPKYAKSGYTFTVWNTKTDGTGTSYKVSDILYMTSDLDLYAQWAPTSSGSGGSGVAITQSETKEEVPPEALTDTSTDTEEYSRSAPDENIKNSVSQHLSSNTPFEDDTLLQAVRDYDRDEGVRLKYINGYPDVTVRPERRITRAEAAQIFYNLLQDYDEGHERRISFNDVNSSDWYYTSVTFLGDLGVINGYTDGSFKPNEYITRAELTTITTKLDVVGVAEQIPFKDMDFTHWAHNSVVSAYEKGWVTTADA